MNRDLAKELVQKYVDGWKDGDSTKITAPLSSDCIVIESHGPRYNGVEEVKKWFQNWRQNGVVLKWNVTSFYFLEKENTAFFEWDFACKTTEKDHEFLGISVVQFSEDKISFIHEYRMIKGKGA